MFTAHHRSSLAVGRRRVGAKRAHGRTPAVFVTGILAMLLYRPSATAGSFPPPVLVQSTQQTNLSVSDVATLADSVGWGGAVLESGVITSIPGPTFYTLDSRSVSNEFTDATTVNKYQMEGTPGAFEAKVLNYAKSTGSEGAFVNTGVGVVTWYVLRGGAPGQKVNLSADIAFQGTLTGSGDGQGAFFNGTMYFAPNPGQTTVTAPLALDAHLNSPNSPTPPPQNLSTVPVISQSSDITVNEVVRSNPFQVQIGVPFGLDLELSAAATTDPGLGSGTITSETNFFDPGLATSFLFPNTPGLTPDGFVLDGSNGSQTTLASNGLTIDLATVPEPSSIVLLGVGLAGMGLTGLRRRILK